MLFRSVSVSWSGQLTRHGDAVSVVELICRRVGPQDAGKVEFRIEERRESSRERETNDGECTQAGHRA